MASPDAFFLRHMIDALRRLEAYVTGTTREGSRENPVLQDAVLRQLTVLGEAAGKVSPAVTRSHPDIPWPDVTGIRHKLVHDYFVIDVDVVWTTATEDAPALQLLVEAALENLEP
jgi:uncharacterized protein with HEPN domain